MCIVKNRVLNGEIMICKHETDWCKKHVYCSICTHYTEHTATISERKDKTDEYKINLIKCKDCKLKHYSESNNLWCDIFERIMSEDGYCCFGER